MTALEPDPRAQIATRYRRFAQFGAAGRSPLYEGITKAVAEDAQIVEWLAEMPEPKQQPNLLLGAVRFLYGTPEEPRAFISLVHDRWDQIAGVMRVRSTQTNEPARCATLLPVLAALAQPLALLEVGAAAGLCLLLDRYAYDYDRRVIKPSAPPAVATPRFPCRASRRTPLPERNVEVAWRAGLDRRPLDLGDEEDVRCARGAGLAGGGVPHPPPARRGGSRARPPAAPGRRRPAERPQAVGGRGARGCH